MVNFLWGETRLSVMFTLSSLPSNSSSHSKTRSGKGEHTLREHEADLSDIPVCENLSTAADLILSAYDGGAQ